MGAAPRLVLLTAVMCSAAPLVGQDVPDVSPDRLMQVQQEYAENMRAAVGEKMTSWLVAQGLSADAANDGRGSPD